MDVRLQVVQDPLPWKKPSSGLLSYRGNGVGSTLSWQGPLLHHTPLHGQFLGKEDNTVMAPSG